MRSAVLLTVAALALGLTGSASAAPPPNDAFASAAAIGSVPFSDGVDLQEATSEFAEPQFCSFKTRSIWYRFQPASNAPVTIDLVGSSPGVVASLYRSFGGGIQNLAFEGCVFGGATTLNAQSGSVYYIQVGDASVGSALVDLEVRPIPPPQNDNFADAKPVGALPYFDTVPMLSSTIEPGEPSPSGILGTAWWSLTASAGASLLISEAGCCGNRTVVVYTGSELGSLEPVPVTRSFGRAIFHAAAGTTYMLQLGHNGLFSSGDVGISVQEAPPPSTAIFWSPHDPSSFDSIGFSGHAFDPAAFPVESWDWDFGDGGTGNDQSTSHRYFADGDYEVTLSIRMVDGRTASSRATVSIRTHDVAIVKLATPKTASAGKTKLIQADVVASGYDETVTVQLFRSAPGGFQHVGTLTQSVAARNRVTTFAMSYTFTDGDAELGKVTFKAVATIAGARDALPADNEIVAPPTKVS